jgi:DNA-binding transcriptional LysR family regulator
MDRFDAMAAFVAVADQNGFAPAARRLGLSPSAITRLVAGLEERLGVRLLNRTTRSVSLTDAGIRFLERSRRILADLTEAEIMAEAERGEPTGRLAIAAPLVFGRLHVAPLICSFMNRYREIQGDLMLADRNANLVEEGIDVAVRIGHLGDSADIVRRAGITRRVLVASPAYLASAGTPALPTDLAGHRTIAFTALSHPRHWRFGFAGWPSDVDVNPTYVTNSADAAIWHALQAGGVTMALSYQVGDLVRAGALRVLLKDHEPEPLPIQFVYSSSRLLSLKVRAFIDMALERTDWTFLDLDEA